MFSGAGLISLPWRESLLQPGAGVMAQVLSDSDGAVYRVALGVLAGSSLSPLSAHAMTITLLMVLRPIGWLLTPLFPGPEFEPTRSIKIAASVALVGASLAAASATPALGGRFLMAATRSNSGRG